jgi:hypothetical protein
MLGILAGAAFDYNTVETVLLFCAVVVTLGGIMFESGQLDSANYVKSRDGVTIGLMIIIILSIIYFFTVLFTELHMMVTEDARRKRLEQQKAVRSGKDGPAPRVDIELGDVQMESNQFVSSAADKKADDVTGLEMDAILSMQEMDAYTWTQVKSKLRDMQMRFKEMQDQLRSSMVASLGAGDSGSGSPMLASSSSSAMLAAGRASPGSPAVNPMIAMAQSRRSARNFSQTRVGGAGAGSPSLSGSGDRRGLLRKSSDVGESQ